MAKLIAFNNVSLDGFFTTRTGDLSWAHKSVQDAEWNNFVSRNASGDGILVFGRITYEMMVKYWPTPTASQNSPDVAERMNSREKIVFSRTLESASWNNTTLLKGDLAPEIRRLKRESNKDMAVLGSGSLVSQLTQEGLIDEYHIVVNPVVLGQGRTLFESVTHNVPLRLTKTRAFANGNVFLVYEPAS